VAEIVFDEYDLEACEPVDGPVRTKLSPAAK
jgi:hypothetical protein